MSLPLAVPVRIVDAFTDTVFRGNPAAVIFLPPLSLSTNTAASTDVTSVMQSCAEELHLSETVFLKPITSKDTLDTLPALPLLSNTAV
eukprot:CAMPEP_0176421500 /NCGR_PEP_ID=MMETSP0127-20121128/9207_1 /TAXON_ID=938130 /ORGANISM="Platyophrya macrostoma, Strain WH" /LENGTH=87 /DNA_ID=CAMNT_0017802235 /DNA_START=33 /DNA_END=292 /DNA_ORIENTATION=-